MPQAKPTALRWEISWFLVIVLGNILLTLCLFPSGKNESICSAIGDGGIRLSTSVLCMEPLQNEEQFVAGGIL